MSDLIERLENAADEIDRRIDSGYFQPCGSSFAKLDREAAQRIAELEAALFWVAEHAPDIEISIAEYAAKALEQADSEGET